MKRADFFKLWVEALRSGEYKQVKSTLVDINIPSGKKAGHCCLGVACEVVNANRKTPIEFVGKNYLPQSVQKLFGITEDGKFICSVNHNGKFYTSLAYMNDDGVKFKTIARIIEEQLEAGNFRKP